MYTVFAWEILLISHLIAVDILHLHKDVLLSILPRLQASN